MTNRDTFRKPDRQLARNGLGKSIFPEFNVNVPMPKDTAVPGSYNKPLQKSPSGSVVSDTPKQAK